MAAVDDFAGFSQGVDGPYRHAAAITAHDTNEIANVTRGIYVGVSGDVKVTTVDGDTVTFKAVPVGVLPVRAKIVFNTGTTATNMLALW